MAETIRYVVEADFVALNEAGQIVHYVHVPTEYDDEADARRHFDRLVIGEPGPELLPLSGRDQGTATVLRRRTLRRTRAADDVLDVEEALP